MSGVSVVSPHFLTPHLSSLRVPCPYLLSSSITSRLLLTSFGGAGPRDEEEGGGRDVMSGAARGALRETNEGPKGST